MKKFLIFLVAIVVVVCIGLTTYYFLRNDEAIDFKTKELYCNVGDVVTLDDLGYTVYKEHRNTTYDYNAGGEDVTQYISFDEDKGYYVANKGGEVNLVITTSNGKYPEFTISVHIGEGTQENPYYLDSQADLEKIGDSYSLSSSYLLMSDINLTEDFKPIGYSNTAVGFSGTFNGNGKTISSLHLSGTEYVNAGLFTQLSGTAKVSDLNLRDVDITGNYQTAGALAGLVNGTVTRVQAVDVNINNTMNNSKTGGLIGSLAGENASVSISGVQDASIVVGTSSSTSNPTPSNVNATVGGFIGEIDRAKVQATFADTNIVMMNASGNVGGFAGKLIITTYNGTIQESYSVSTSEYANFGSFLGSIEKGTNFVQANANQLRHLIGNYAINGGTGAVNSYDSTFFDKGFYDVQNHIYFIVTYNTEDELKANTEYIFYAINGENRVYWDSSAWSISIGELPELRMTNATLSTVSSEYFLRDMEEDNIGQPTDPVNPDDPTDPSDPDDPTNPDDGTAEENGQTFIEKIQQYVQEGNGAIVGKKIVLNGDVDLTGINWTPVELRDSSLDGNGHTIRGLNLTTLENGNTGLFSVINNSTVRNLTIENVTFNLTGSATNVGALAGEVKSDTSNSSSYIEDVNIKYSSAIDIDTTYFGGLVALVDNNSTITNSSVEGLDISSSANISYAGGLIGGLNSGMLIGSSISADNIYADQRLAGAVAINDGTINNVSGDVIITYANNNYNAYVGGISAENDGTITDSSLEVRIVINQTNRTLYVGGATAINNGTISNVRLTGAGITIQNISATDMYVGGVVATNNATINNAYNLMTSVGSYYEGKNFYVGGIAANNSTSRSTISQSIAGSDVYGNYVSGAVVNMTNAGAKLDQILIGKYNSANGNISQNYITGDKFVAGVSYNFSAGNMTDIQAVSELYGKLNSTRTSLLVLIFPNSASLINATVNSSVDGYGSFYRETWRDYTNTMSSGTADNYNIYAGTAASGRMESVVVNNDEAVSHGKTLIVAEFNSGQWNTSYGQSNNNNNVKVVTSSEFNRSSTFTGTHTLTAKVWYLFIPINKNYVRELKFDFSNNIWTQGSGIELSFLENV